MSARYFLAWMLLEEERSREQYRYLREMRESLRGSFDPVEDLPETEFRKRYRLSKEAFVFLCEELRQRTNLRPSQRVSLEIKVLTALIFYATGSYQRPIGVAKNICQKSCSRYLEEVTQALVHPEMMSKYIIFPQTISDRKAVSQQFNTKYGIPGVIGCIDCTHIKIVKPTEEEHLYFCRKNYHSMNVQMICDSNYRVLNVNPKYGGSNHDSFIWENSRVNDLMQNLHQRNEIVWLLGDSGYPQRPWLMTPYPNNVAADTPQGCFNQKHIRARVTIENTFGRLKNRWRCLCKDRVLHYKPVKCAQIIQACCVLNNIALDFGVPEPEGDLGGDDEDREEGLDPGSERDTDLIRGRAFRDQLAGRMFSQQA